MDLFKFRSTEPYLEGGELINGTTSVMWVERYRENGEFTIIAPVSSNLRTMLPLGTLISHMDTTEVMVVENHEIVANTDDELEITITGRSLETTLENRIVGANRTMPLASGAALPEYTLAADYTWIQAVTLVNDHIYGPSLIDSDDELINMQCLHQVAGTSVSEERPLKRATVYKHLLEIAEVDDLGIKTVRPGIWSPYPVADRKTAFIIHVGNDLTDSIVFSYASGEVQNAQYLWSNKKLKTSALVTSKWLETVVNGPEANYDRRTMFVDASEIDSAETVAPTGATRTAYLAIMATLGNQALAAQKEIALAKADINKAGTRYLYRTDYEVGDLVMVHGDYDTSRIMRVVEYVEIDDENGESGYPTLSVY